MISTTGLVHIAALFAIVVITVTEIKLGKDHCNWLPILATIVGYLMPQPQFTHSTKKRPPVSSSMLHLDPDFAPLQNTADSETPTQETEATRDTVKQHPNTKSYRTLFVESLPSLALLTAVAVWATISLTSDIWRPTYATLPTLSPTSYHADLASTVKSTQKLDPQRTHDERFGTSSVCEYLQSTAEANGICNDNSFDHTVKITNGSLGMCYVQNKEIGAKLQLIGSNSTFSSGYTGWRLLLFRMARISDRLHKSLCNDMTLGYINETASSCNGRVTITGYPDQITLSAHQWNEMVFYIPDVLLAMLHCQPYTSANN
jgi:hypothetical protein